MSRPLFSRRVRAVLTLCALLALSLSTHAKTIRPKPGWLPASDFERAFEIARETNRPVAVLYCFRFSQNPIHNGAVEQFMTTASLNGFVRVLVTNDEASVLRDYPAKAKGGGGIIPEVYLIEPDGRLAGFADHDHDEVLYPLAKMITELTAWRSAAPGRIAAADKLADEGRFRSAMAIITTLSEQDLKATQTIARGLGAPDAEENTEVRENEDRAPRARDEAAKQRHEKNKESSTRKKGNQDVDLPTVGVYFPTLRDEKRGAYEKLANARLDKAREHIEGKELGKARQLLVPLLSDKGDFAAHKEAATLMQELNKLQRAAK